MIMGVISFPFINRMSAMVAEIKAGNDKLANWLTDNGFERVDRVDVPGQFAHPVYF